jgi:dephospho-CoA kinase
MDRSQRLEHADDIINNELPVQSLKQQIEALHQQYLAMAIAKRKQ